MQAPDAKGFLTYLLEHTCVVVIKAEKRIHTHVYTYIYILKEYVHIYTHTYADIVCVYMEGSRLFRGKDKKDGQIDG